MKVLWNDQLVERDTVAIDIEDRGYQYGDGLYEVIRVYQGQLFMVEEHLTRLWTGAEKIRLTLPFSKEELLQRLQQLVAAEQIQEGKLYFQITRGIASPRTHAFPDPSLVQGVLTANIIPYSRPVEKQQQGIRLGRVEDVRWLHCDIKSLSLLGNLLALDEAQQQGYDDALLVRDGVVTEASAANFWMVKDNCLYTHPDGKLVLSGITKRQIIKLAGHLGVQVIQQPFSYEELLTADEAFISGSLIELIPVVAVDGQLIAEGIRGAVTAQLQQAYIAATVTA